MCVFIFYILWKKCRLFPVKKDLSDSSAGWIFFRQHYNEGLKFGVFSYLISRCKCYRPNKTNFMDFCWKLLIFWRFKKNNGFSTFMWVMLKTALKKLVQFSIGRKIAKNHSIFKKMTILEFSDSSLSNYFKKHSVFGNI